MNYSSLIFSYFPQCTSGYASLKVCEIESLQILVNYSNIDRFDLTIWETWQWQESRIFAHETFCFDLLQSTFILSYLSSFSTRFGFFSNLGSFLHSFFPHLLSTEKILHKNDYKETQETKNRRTYIITMTDWILTSRFLYTRHLDNL